MVGLDIEIESRRHYSIIGMMIKLFLVTLMGLSFSLLY